MLIDRKRDATAIEDNVDEMFRKSMTDYEHRYVVYDVITAMGDPVDTILEKANSENYDLLIMAKHGHGALKGALMGDTCQHVVRRCQKPVLIVEVPPKEDSFSLLLPLFLSHQDNYGSAGAPTESRSWGVACARDDPFACLDISRWLPEVL